MGRRRKQAGGSSSSGSRKWGSETELCQAFATAANVCGWDTYPEVDGWDLVLAKPVPKSPSSKDPISNRLETGPDTRLSTGLENRPIITIGIQAKLRRSWKVLAQAVKRPKSGPDYRAVLVPDYDKDFATLCQELGIGLYTQEGWYRIDVPSRATRRDPVHPIVLPSIPDVGLPGSPSPVRLTPWRERAIVLCRVLLLRGFLTGADFDRLGVNRKTWRDSGWIRADGMVVDDNGSVERRVARYRLATAPDLLPDAGYDESVRAAVFQAWCVKEPWLGRAVESCGET